MDITKISLIGNAGRDAEIYKSLDNKEKDLAKVSLGVSMKSHTSWFDLCIPGYLHNLVPHIKKGTRIYADGKIIIDKKIDKDLKEYFKAKVIAENIVLLDGQDKGGFKQL
jgi:hypothetical protein